MNILILPFLSNKHNWHNASMRRNLLPRLYTKCSRSRSTISHFFVCKAVQLCCYHHQSLVRSPCQTVVSDLHSDIVPDKTHNDEIRAGGQNNTGTVKGAGSKLHIPSSVTSVFKTITSEDSIPKLYYRW